jgi:GNAT superfamily N-acetyltransferase
VSGPPLREFRPADDVAALTDLLHRAYAELGDAGLNFTAVDQTEATTLYRASSGYCLVAEDGRQLVGTVTMSIPPSASIRRMFPDADRAGVAWLTQLGVDPVRRGERVATRLWEAALQWAIDQGATTIGIDTAIPATHLIEIYRRWGFEPAGTIHWDGKTYDSVVLLLTVEEPHAAIAKSESGATRRQRAFRIGVAHQTPTLR